MKGIRFDDFSGGYTDKDIPGVQNRYAIANNLLIGSDKKLFSRDGFDVFSSTAYNLAGAVPSGTTKRVAALVNFDNDSEILAFQEADVFSIASGAWAALAGPTGGDSYQEAFASNAPEAIVTHTQWNHHLYAAAIPGSFTGTVNIGTGGWVSAANSTWIGMPVRLTTTGALPTGLTTNVTYYVILVINAGSDTFKLSATLGGGAIALSGTQSGVHTLTPWSNDPPIKVYRDSAGAIQLRTAGLPEIPDTLYPADGGLADANTLANDLRQKMIDHFGSKSATVGVQGNTSDKCHVDDAGGVLDTQGTDAAATVAATSLASLITLVNALRGLYGRHIADAQIEYPTGRLALESTAVITPRAYHMSADTSTQQLVYAVHSAYNPGATAYHSNQPLYPFRHFLNLNLQDPSYTVATGSVIADVLPYLNDLRDKWNWHTYAPVTHYNANVWFGVSEFTNLGVNATAYARVEPYTWAKIAPNYGPLIQFIQDLKGEFDAHRTYDMHMVEDSVFAIPSGVDATPDDFWEAINLLGWLCYAISFHAGETDVLFCANGTLGTDQRAGSTTSGAATLSLDGVGGFAVDKYRGMRVAPVTSISAAPYLWALFSNQGVMASSVVSGSDVATPCIITTGTNFTATVAGWLHTITSRRYHVGAVGSAALFTPAEINSDMIALDYSLTTSTALQGIADFAQDLADVLKLHTIDRETIISEGAATSVMGTFTKNGKNYSKYQPTTLDGAVGEQAFVHLGMNYTDFPSGTIYPYGLRLSLNAALTATNTVQTQPAEDRFALAPTAGAFNYKMLFRYDYTVGDVSYTDRGAPSSIIQSIGFVNEQYGGNTELGKYAATFTNLYAQDNMPNENWATEDTTNFKKEIYRTIPSDTAGLYYRADVDGVGGSVQNSVTTYYDVSCDEFVINNLALYTNSGEPENNRPPLASCIHVFENTAYYVLGNKVYQSIPSDPDSVPADFYEEFQEAIVAVSSSKGVPIAFSANKVYRITGFIDSLGRGAVTYESIFDLTGVISPQALVKIDDGVVFAGKDGFYFTNGYSCIRLTDQTDTFKAFTNTAVKKNAIVGAYDSVAKRVYWTIPTSSSVPDKIWVLDLQFGNIPELTPVTTFSCQTSFNPTSVIFYSGILHYADNDGYVFKQTEDRLIDLVKAVSTAATAWDSQTVIWDYKSCHMDFGSADVRKYFTTISTQFLQEGKNLSVQINSDADKGRITSSLPVIRSRKLVTADGWGDSNIDWIASLYTAKAGNTIDERRWFNGDGSLRSNYRAIELTNAYCVIVNSTDMGTLTLAFVSGTTWTATLTSLVATRKWPLYSVGYYIRIAGVDYPITVRTSDSVVSINASGLTTPTAGVPASWELWGYPKNEKMNLIGYTIDVDVADQNQTSSEGPVATGGENA